MNALYQLSIIKIKLKVYFKKKLCSFLQKFGFPVSFITNIMSGGGWNKCLSSFQNINFLRLISWFVRISASLHIFLLNHLPGHFTDKASLNQADFSSSPLFFVQMLSKSFGYSKLWINKFCTIPGNGFAFSELTTYVLCGKSAARLKKVCQQQQFPVVLKCVAKNSKQFTAV